jgi:hypothetical protein
VIKYKENSDVSSEGALSESLALGKLGNIVAETL